MVFKLCLYLPRNNIIIQIIKELLQTTTNTENINAKKQIMVLAQNKNILKFLYDTITENNIASVGYYIGGMKKNALEESEKKQIILATYSMASEGLDIKTLNTLIMATPRTDIEQSVGRILREKHDEAIVIDVVDTHQIFKNQWIKRKRFYKKENYLIQTFNVLKDVPFGSIFNAVNLENDDDDNADNDDDDDVILNKKSSIGKCLL
jgi:superfamily II DNA or RNA helicase